MKQKKSPMFWVLKRIRKRLPAMSLMIAAHITTALLGVFFALGSRQVIDSATGGSRDAFFRACLLQGSIILGLILFNILYRHLRDLLTAELDRDWKQDLLHVLLHGDYATVSAYHSGELINRLNNDVRIVGDGLLQAIPNVAAMVVRLIAAMVALAALEPVFSLLVIATGVAAVLVTGLMRQKLKDLHKRVSEEDGRVSAFLQEILEKLLMVQALDVSGEMERRTDNLLQSRFEAQRIRKNISLAANAGINIMAYFAGFAALVWCSAGLLMGTTTFGSLTAVIQLVNQLQVPFSNLSGVIPQYVAMTAAAERLMELESLEREPEPDAQSPAEVYRDLSAIGAEGLCFSYDRDEVLHEADFSLPKGTFAVITGPSGIGKSTLLKLMLGIFGPEGGRFYLESEDGTRKTLTRATRRMFAYVPQVNLLLSGTLRENLTIVRPDATEEEIRQAVHISAMEEYLPQLPQGLDTVLGENAAGLSEGQAQRLAIARAILSGAPIILLDEGTSALDAQTEQLVLERIRTLKEHTCIAVTHRPAAIALCDWDLQIRDGKIHMVKIEH